MKLDARIKYLGISNFKSAQIKYIFKLLALSINNLNNLQVSDYILVGPCWR